MKVLAGLGAIVVAGAALAMAQPVPGGHGRRPDGAAMQQRLGLSDEQMSQMRTLRSTERKAAIRRRADIAIARMELNEALSAPTMDEKVVASKVKTLTELQAAALQARVNQRIAFRKLLTPEQQAKLGQLARERGADRRGERNLRRQWPGRRGGPMAPNPNSGPGGPAPEPESEE